jgi:ACS family glucarate transporter-like MFS transporter
MNGPPPDASRRHELVLLGLCLAAAIAYVHRGCLGVAESTIRDELQISEKAMGFVMAAFFLTYSIFQIPTGWLVDRWGPRRSLLWFGMLGAGTVAFGAVGGVAFLVASRLAMGGAQAGLFPAATVSLAAWYPGRRRAFAVGTLAASMSLGSALGAPLTGVLLEPLGWRALFVLYAVPGVAWSLWFYGFFRDRPAAAPPPPPRARTPWKAIFTSAAMWWIIGQQFFRAMATVFYLTWFTTFLVKRYGLTTEAAGGWTALPLVGVVCGSLVGGVASDRVMAWTGSRVWGRKGVAMATLAVGVGLFAAAYHAADVRLAVPTIAAAAFFTSMANPCSYSLTMDMGGRHTAIVFSAMNMGGNVGATVFPILVPFWLQLADGDWGSVLFLVGGIYLAGAACWLLLDPRGTIEEPGERQPAAHERR